MYRLWKQSSFHAPYENELKQICGKDSFPFTT